jgi:tRNA(Ile2) C34 agmatinyltransferase TiaS
MTQKRCEECGRWMGKGQRGWLCNDCLERLECKTVTELVRDWAADVYDSIPDRYMEQGDD